MNNGMSHGEFRNYLGLLSRLLRLKTVQREAIEEELRTHLEERFAALTAEGVEPDRAVSMALEEFGDAAALAAQFSAISKLQRRRWMMRLTMGSIAATVLLVAVVASLWPDGSGDVAVAAAHAQQVAEPAPLPLSTEQQRNAETEAKLKKVTSVDFVEEPLQDVLEYMAKMAEVQFHIDQRALDDVGVGADMPITFRMKDLPVEVLLRLMLRPSDLGYMFDHGVVIVSTQEELDSCLETRVYRVRDLVEKDYVSHKPESPFEAQRMPKEKRRVRHGVDNLIALIKATSKPASWDQVGGPGSICYYRGALVISQRYSVHREVENLLEDLRKAIAE